ncbi:MAG TPA: FAD-dependent oxidoreductase [Terriglobales bacterium]|nr:FAD-dependent oxidoreductase [Terriglobales bacterium]
MAVNPEFDLAVIGGGPAGAAAAFTAARRGLRVALLERGAFPRDKVCGEFLSSEALPLLRQMAPELLASAPVIATAAFVSPRGRRAGFPLPAPARGISRLALDAALWQAAGAAGAELLHRTLVTRVTPDSSGFRLALASGETLAARALIVAAGRCWRLPGLDAATPPPTAPSPWVGLKARFRGLPLSPAVEMFPFRGGYCGLAPVENGWTNACCLIHRRHAGDLVASRDFAAWIATASRSHPLIERLRGGEQATPTVVTAPVAMGPRAACVGAALAAGDASGFIDPFTGDGLARALLSGQLAAHAIADATPAAYPAALARAALSSFRASAALRLGVAAPPWLQSLALTLLARPPLGPRLVAATRWSLS